VRAMISRMTTNDITFEFYVPPPCCATAAAP
jgi:hypothetical protein